jgi:hypothetical protein
VDKQRRRISLSIRRAGEAPSAPRKRDRRGDRPARARDKTPNPAPGGVTLTHTMAEQLGVLKDKLRKHA